MTRKNILFLAADTSRSKAYAQTMADRGVLLSDTLMFKHDDSERNRVYKTRNHQCMITGHVNGILLPDLSVPLVTSCSQISRRIHCIDSDTVNSPSICALIQDISPELVVYSGYGGQIVGNKLLSLGIPFLHVHGGYLPEFRGSTTQYYSMIQDRLCGVSAILLTNHIDQGPVVAKKTYPVPEPFIDMDYQYDNALRADLLAEVLARWDLHSLENKTAQSSEEGGMFYIIHPVLKHLAILSLQPEFRNPEN